MTKTKRKKKYLKKLNKIRENKKKIKKIEMKAKNNGFKSPYEYILWERLKQNGIEVYHNILLYGFEIDLFILPNIIIELGYLDNTLRYKWSKFEKLGYIFHYVSNLEVREVDILKKVIIKIKNSLEINANLSHRKAYLYTQELHECVSNV